MRTSAFFAFLLCLTFDTLSASASSIIYKLVRMKSAPTALAFICSATAFSDNGAATRKPFLSTVPSTASGLAFFDFVQVNHSASCTCGTCTGTFVHVTHSASCKCGTCSDNSSASRRTFLSSVPSTAAGLAFGTFVNVNHGASCSCGKCSFGFGPVEVKAEPASNMNLSPDFYAQDLEAKRTLSRLEKKGFKLDTEEERTIRLNDALSSFSYDSATSSKTKSSARNSISSSKADSKSKLVEQK